jgi:DNA modification methylase
MSVVHLGDCLDIMRTFAPDSFDAIVTDPPAGISFMNKAWDNDKGGRDAWAEAHREHEQLRLLEEAI